MGHDVAALDRGPARRHRADLQFRRRAGPDRSHVRPLRAHGREAKEGAPSRRHEAVALRQGVVLGQRADGAGRRWREKGVLSLMVFCTICFHGLAIAARLPVAALQRARELFFVSCKLGAVSK